MAIEKIFFAVITITGMAAGDKESLGIDLGRNTIRAAVAKQGRSRIVLNTMSERYFPCLVGWRDDGEERLLCESGAQGHHVVHNVRDLAATDPTGEATISENLSVTHLESLGMVLQHVKILSGNTVEPATISVPPYYSSSQRQRVIDASLMAGMKHPTIISDPAAMLITYSNIHDFSNQDPVKSKVLFVTLTASHASVTAARCTLVKGSRLDGGSQRLIMQRSVQILSSVTSTNISVDAMVGNLVMEYWNDAELHVLEDGKNRRKIFARFRKTMEVLTSRTEAEITIEDFGVIKKTVTRKKFESVNQDQIAGLQRLIKTAMKTAKISPSNLGSVEIYGGGSRIPFVQAAIMESTKKSALGNRLDKDEASAIGAAVHASNLTVPDVALPMLRHYSSIEYTVIANGKVFTIPPSPVPHKMQFDVETAEDELTVEIKQGSEVQSAYKLSKVQTSAAQLHTELSGPGVEGPVPVKIRVVVRESGIVELTRAKITVKVSKVVEVAKKNKKGKKGNPMSKKVEEEKYTSLPIDVTQSAVTEKAVIDAGRRKLNKIHVKQEKRKEFASARNDLEVLLYDAAELQNDLIDNPSTAVPDFLITELKEAAEKAQIWHDTAPEPTTHDYNHRHLSLSRKMHQIEQLRAVEDENTEENCVTPEIVESSTLQEEQEEDPLATCLSELHEVKKQLHEEREANKSLRKKLEKAKKRSRGN